MSVLFNWEWLVERLWGKAVQHGASYEDRLNELRNQKDPSYRADKGIIGYNGQIEVFEKQSRNLERKAETEKKNAKRYNKLGNKPMALKHLAEMKRLQKRQNDIDAAIGKLRQQVGVLETSQFQRDAVLTMHGIKQLGSEITSTITVEDIQELQSDIKEQAEATKAIGRELGLTVDEGGDAIAEVEAAELLDLWDSEDQIYQEEEKKEEKERTELEALEQVMYYPPPREGRLLQKQAILS